MGTNVELSRLTNEVFLASVSGTPVTLVFIWDPAVAPSRMMLPALDALGSERRNDGLVILKLTADDNPGFVDSSAIRTVPTILVYKDGEVVDNIVGVVPKGTVATMIDKWLTPGV